MVVGSTAVRNARRNFSSAEIGLNSSIFGATGQWERKARRPVAAGVVTAASGATRSASCPKTVLASTKRIPESLQRPTTFALARWRPSCGSLLGEDGGYGESSVEQRDRNLVGVAVNPD